MIIGMEVIWFVWVIIKCTLLSILLINMRKRELLPVFFIFAMIAFGLIDIAEYLIGLNIGRYLIITMGNGGMI